MSRLILVRGIPGSGKSTFCKTMFPDIYHIENDMFHYKNGIYQFDIKKQKEAIRWCMECAEFAMLRQMDVIVSNTFTRCDFIESYKKLAKQFDYQFLVYRMQGKYNNTHDVPTQVLKNMKDKFEDYNGEIFVNSNYQQTGILNLKETN